MVPYPLEEHDPAVSQEGPLPAVDPDTSPAPERGLLRAALRFRPSDGQKPEEKKKAAGQRVYLLEKDNKLKAVPVKVGVSDGTHTQLVEGDLQEGDPLVVEEIRKSNGTSGGGGPRMRFF